MSDYTEQINIEDVSKAEVLGLFDVNLKKIKDHFKVNVSSRGGILTIGGDPEKVSRAADIMQAFVQRVHEGKQVTANYVDALIAGGREGMDSLLAGLDIYPRTDGQKKYLQAISRNDMVFVTGPAGTGKTYLAVACAVSALKASRVRKIVLVRPAVEAGEKLGFLPGDLREKVNPYLIPIYDALYEMLGYDIARTYMERGIVEVVPIAFMRGRTLHNSFIIMDEGQNTTCNQMLMFLTRMGVDAKVVVTGDVTQIDLPSDTPCGLLHAVDVLKKVKGIGFVRLEPADIVRHKLVRDIVRLFKVSPGG